MVARSKSHRLPSYARSDAHRQSGVNAKATVCAPELTADGFLNHGFTPLYPPTEELADQQGIEADFFMSATHLSALYGLDLDIYKLEWEHEYPFNIQYTYQLVSEKLEAIDKQTEVLILSDDTRKATLTTVQTFDTDFYSYFIPVKPLFLLQKAGADNGLTDLLTSVYAYLLHVIGLPFPSDLNSYVYYQCDMMVEYRSEYTGREEREEYRAFKKVVKQSRRQSRIVHNRVKRNIHLKNFPKRFAAFQPQSADEAEFKTIVGSFLDLYTRFPDRSVWNSYFIGLITPEEEYRIHPDQFISFIWDFDDGIYDELVMNLDADFNGGGYVELPLTMQFFDQPQLTQTLDLDYEKILFSTLGQLIPIQHKLSSDAKHN